MRLNVATATSPPPSSDLKNEPQKSSQTAFRYPVWGQTWQIEVPKIDPPNLQHEAGHRHRLHVEGWRAAEVALEELTRSSKLPPESDRYTGLYYTIIYYRIV